MILKNFILSFIFIGTSISYNFAQCPTSENVPCGMMASQYDNVVLGEISGDAGQSDGCNDAIVEIVGPPGTDIGCMVVSDSEWAVLIPSGSAIPADGVFLIACSTDMSASCGVGINGGSNGLIAGADPAGVEGGGLEGDFNAGLLMEIDLDVCDAANATFYDPAASGFTLDNTGATDGEQVLLFLPDGTPHDGIYWGGNGGSGGADHCSVQNGNPYTLGDNDGNGVVNDNAGSLPGGQCSGNNATAVPVIPTDMACGCNTPGAPGTFTMPPLTDPIWFNMTPTSATFVGCNSSWVRGGPTTGSHGSPSHMDGEVTSSAQVGGQNTDNGGGATGGATGDTFSPVLYTPSSCGDPSAEWNYTDHPTPGQPNNDPTFVFYASDFIACATDEEITFTVEIYNYQNVSDGSIDGMSGIDDVQAGSFVEVNGVQMIYDTYVVAGETTTMTFSFSSWNIGSNTVAMVWDDYSNCCGTSGNPATQSNPNECYETEVFMIEIIEPIAYDCDGDGVADGSPGTPCAISCPTDSPQGTVNVSNFVTGGGTVNYELFNAPAGAAGTGISSNTTGVFLLPTSMVDGPYEVIVTDQSGCSTETLTVSIEDSCELPPVCPENLDVSASTPDADVCPGEMVELCLDGDNLPAGGMICWYATTDGSDPVSEDAANAMVAIGASAMQIGCVEIPSTPSSIPSGGPVLNEVLYDPAGNDGSNACEAVEIAGTPGTDISCFMVSDGDFVVVIPDGTTIPADGFFVIASGGCDGTDYAVSEIDLVTSTCGCTNAAGASFNLTNGGEHMGFYDASGNLINGVIFEENVDGDNNGPNGQTPTIVNPTGCTNSGFTVPTVPDYDLPPAPWAFIGTNVVNSSIELGTDVTGTWQPDSDGGNTIGSSNSATPAADPTCIMYTIPDLCAMSPATITIEPLIDPIDPNCVDGDFNYVGAASTFTIDCPSAALDMTPIDICEADATTAMIPITISGGSGLNYTVEYAINGVAQPSVSIANGGTIDISGPTMGEIKVTLLSIVDQGGALCSGSVSDTEVCVNIRPTETLTITGSANPTSCDPCDGEVTFDISGGGTSNNIFEISYTFNGSSFLLAGVSMPFTISNACPGVYDIESVEDEVGCAMNIVSNEQTLTQPTGDPVSVSGGPGIVCDDGTGTVDLTTEFTYVPAFNATDFAFFSADPNTLPPAALPTAMLPSTTLMLTADQTVWVQYTDANGCTSVAALMIDVDPSACVLPFTCPDIAALTVTGDVCDNNEFTLTTTGLDDTQMMQASGGGPFQIQYVYYTGAGSAPANPYTTPGTPLGGPISASGGMASLTTNNAGLPVGDLTIVAILSPTPTDDACIPFASVDVNNIVCDADAGRFDD